jgi:hypothetical protein
MHTLAILFMLVLAGPAQRIATQYPDREKVTRLETAMNHLTVIELSDPVTLAAAGSPLFKIDRRGNKVFIQPLEEGAATNLFIWTDSGRFAYELVPATSIESAHFAIDERPAPIPPPENLDAQAPDSDASASIATPSMAEELLLLARPIRRLDVKFEANRLGAFITDVLRKDGQLFIRYVIDNRTTRPYQASMPDVFVLRSVQSRTSLHSYRYSQLGEQAAKEIKSRSETRAELGDCDVPSDPLPSGEMAAGILTVRLPETPAANSEVPQVVRIVFPSAGGKPISVIVVL